MSQGKSQIDRGELKGDWYIRKIRNRVFRVTHAPTDRVFQITGAPTIHKWTVDEIRTEKDTKGRTVEKSTTLPLVDWNSMKRMLGQLDNWINVANRKTEKPPVRELESVRDPRGPWRSEAIPGQPVKIKKAEITKKKIRYTIVDTGQKFIAEANSRYWNLRVEGGQVIAKDLESIADVQRELTAYVSTTEFRLICPPGDVKVIIEQNGKNYLVQSKRDDGYVLSASIETLDSLHGALLIEKRQLERMGYGDFTTAWLDVEGEPSAPVEFPTD